MLNQVIRRAYYLKHHLEASLLKEREEYLQFLANKGLYNATPRKPIYCRLGLTSIRSGCGSGTSLSTRQIFMPK